MPVIDTVGVKVGPYRVIDRFGTPYTQALHVVERYRFLDYEAPKEALARAKKEWASVGTNLDPNYRGKGLQLEFTVEDDGVFGVDLKPPQAAVVKSHGSKRCGKVGT
jgi:hypothetical protein